MSRMHRVCLEVSGALVLVVGLWTPLGGRGWLPHREPVEYPHVKRCCTGLPDEEESLRSQAAEVSIDGQTVTLQPREVRVQPPMAALSRTNDGGWS